ncbi:helix-turn-helix transcriptional regulator [Pseudomonas chlororaphis]|uniref:helix-turn-helix transcriptional regulator n=1 Tax=Pseudomonas chlororaphis TaxID=587753 RepID=UPI000F58DA87|nr:AlpA family phage regulatory protein [Pseudomonas chlororaphis]AZE07290.1 Prophage CP4-57 regulatory [Pseudomonas chlororaphis subsp. aureofaciens]MBP5057415.1 AlpA family phage regulatory protein [Pseudomonas chlororaphis]MBP5142363.1 AlpA family phage regulatory protein [Pseudomonas chlororaphis]MBP5144085.1 AlpA family phage regulatory protein [Pseudomonas chlororaphis]MBP5144360.1 AlpA family phage regulatory protein [Pseudomonas chlororaphis]
MNTSITELSRKAPANSLSLFDATSTLIRMREVEGIVGMKRSTIYKLMQRPDCGFPQPVKLSNSNARGAPVAWVLSEVQAWARNRIKARDQVAA